MSRDRCEGDNQDDLYSLISSTTDLFTSLDVTDSVTDLTTSDSSQKTSTLTQTISSRTEDVTENVKDVTKSDRKRTDDKADEGFKNPVDCDDRQILSARGLQLHNHNCEKISTDV